MIAGGDWKAVTSSTATTNVVVRDHSCVLERIVIPSSAAGTIALYDSSTTAGTSTTTLFLTVAGNTVDFPESIECNISCKSGLTYTVGGTPDMTLVVR